MEFYFGGHFTGPGVSSLLGPPEMGRGFGHGLYMEVIGTGGRQDFHGAIRLSGVVWHEHFGLGFPVYY